MIDNFTATVKAAAAYDQAHAHAPDVDRPSLADLAPDCHVCGDTGWITYGCTRDPDCSGGSCCDRRCTCETGRQQ